VYAGEPSCLWHEVHEEEECPSYVFSVTSTAQAFVKLWSRVTGEEPSEQEYAQAGALAEAGAWPPGSIVRMG
jgi:hypothetical protein